MANNGKKQPSPFCIRFTGDERKTLEQAAGGTQDILNGKFPLAMFFH